MTITFTARPRNEHRICGHLLSDTFYYLALLNPEDESHLRAVRLSHQLTGRTITTIWVMAELGDALAVVEKRKTFVAFYQGLTANPYVQILPVTREQFDSGLRLYAQRPDKDWSLTDCISFVVMREHGVTDALTGDHHFEQAGFKALLK